MDSKAFAWVLIDLCKYYIADKNLNQAGICFKELYTIDLQGYEDEIIENQKAFFAQRLTQIILKFKKQKEQAKTEIIRRH